MLVFCACVCLFDKMKTTEWSPTCGGGGGVTSGWQAVYAVLQIRFHANECGLALVCRIGSNCDLLLINWTAEG